MEITILYNPSSIDEMVRMNRLAEATMHKFGAKYLGFGRVLPDLQCSRSYEIDPRHIENAKASLELHGFSFIVTADN